MLRRSIVAFVLGFALSCDASSTPPAGDALAVGEWGGAKSGVIVGDTLVHVHINCTFGNVSGRIVLDENGHFDVAGSYQLRAFPIVRGPEVPAQFVGDVRGNQLTLLVAVNDTVDKVIRVLGPVTVRLGRTPELGPCPICTMK